MEGFIVIFSFFAIVSFSLIITRICVKNGLNEKFARLLFSLLVGTGVASLMIRLTRKVNEPEDVPVLFLIIMLLFGLIAWVNAKGSYPVRKRGTFQFNYKNYNLLVDPLTITGGIKKVPEQMRDSWKDLKRIHKALPILLFLVCLIPPLVMTFIAVYKEWIQP
ncbi:hypothetical protein [Halobacillus sp. BBL2006]|uniref:hypothetical protein n=1 Tax=Halobacillus sp. BBL2006 TaxID=1543706 RepID=UPI001E59528B|nr:hypothetical protein [Halobacillus sp. BBL2006]